MLKVIELFAGIGAQRKGLERAGIEHEVVAISEIDKYALKVYETLYGNTPNLGDISKIEKLPKADMWTYSFPCTDISLSGRMKGLEKGSGTHSSLLWEVQRLLEVSKANDELPKYLLLENVKNLISKKFKPYFDEWCRYLESLGYKNFYKVLNGKNYNVPQNRKRIFLLSIRNCDEDYVFPNDIPLTTKLGDLLESNVADKYFLSEKLITCFSSMKNRNGLIRGLRFRPRGKNDEYAWTITTAPGSRATDTFIIEPIPAAIRGRANEDGTYRQQLELKKDGNTNTLTTVQKDNVVIVPQNTKQGYAIAHVGDGIYTNRADSKRGVVQRESIPTLKTSNKDIAVVVGDPIDLISIRRLTPRECWRLMGWSDDDIDKAFKANVSETQLYKMAGNSIIVNCLEAIFKNIRVSEEMMI
jgi:DNA (cytosine-5)-methyltransferase 1